MFPNSSAFCSATGATIAAVRARAGKKAARFVRGSASVSATSSTAPSPSPTT
jgi:hypothetical protein